MDDIKRCLYSPFLARRIFTPLSKWKWGPGGSRICRFDKDTRPTTKDENLVRIINDTFGREKIGIRGFWTSLTIGKGTIAILDGECYVMVVAEKGYSDVVWLHGHGPKHNNQLLRELPRTKIGSNIEHYTIIAEWQPPSQDIKQAEIQQMEDLHYRMGPMYLPKGSCLGEWLNGRDIPSLIDIPYGNRGELPMDHFERRLVEICCGERSALGRYTCASARCDRVRIDKSLDILNEETKRLVVKALCSENTAVWLSLPCTGGSKWNSYNYSRSPSSRESIDEKVELYFRILEICKK